MRSVVLNPFGMRFISSQDHRWKRSNIIGFYLFFFFNCGFIAFVLHVYENWKAELIVQNPWNLKRNSFPFKQRCPRYYFSGYKFSHTHTHLLYVFFFLLSPSGFNGRVPKQLITNLPPIFFIAFLPSMFLFVFFYCADFLLATNNSTRDEKQQSAVRNQSVPERCNSSEL